LRSGIPLPRSLSHLATAHSRAAKAAGQLAPLVEADLPAAFSRVGFAKMDVEILDAGARSGCLDEACERLSEYYGCLATGRRQVIAASLYPIFILHFAAVMLAIPPALMKGSMEIFLRDVGIFLGIAYFLGFLVFLAVRFALRASKSDAAADQMISLFPLFGGLLRFSALSRFCLVLSLGIRSADGITSSLLRAGNASQSALVGAACKKAADSIRIGGGFSEALGRSPAFPADLKQGFHVAEVSGRLDTEMARWAAIFRERLFARIQSLAAWLPKWLYIFVLAAVAYRIFSIVSQMTGVYTEILNEM